MPRTKQPRKVKQKKVATINDPVLAEMVKQLDTEERQVLAQLESMFEDIMMNFMTTFKEERCTNNVKNNNKTLSELTREIKLTQLQENVTASTKSTRKGLRRSKSYAKDEGYLTAESTRSISGGGRQSRTAAKTTKKPRVSRSLSRSAANTASTAKKNNYAAPKNKPPQMLGVITPKIKANTPQILLRRPKQGEMAVSMQGSPLMVSGVVMEQECTVSIPFNNGSTLAIAPLRGLRVSQIPDLDDNTKKQLAVLRDNINKICNFR